MSEPRRILLVDDDEEVRSTYREFFNSQPDYQVVGEEPDGSEIVAAYLESRPDIVLMDLNMPNVSGIEAIRLLHSHWPDACIVAMTTFGTREYVVTALQNGASGYLLKEVGGTALLAAMDQAVRGEMPLSSSVRRALVRAVLEEEPAPMEQSALSPREVELVTWLTHGFSNQQIAERMFLAEGSVKQYLARLSEKLGVSSRTQVIVRSIQLGVVDPSSVPLIGGDET